MSKTKIVKQSGEAVITIKGSKFISISYAVNSKADIDGILNSLKKEHYKATHICYAYRIGRENIVEFSTDAGEPSGTAGKPILGAVKMFDVTDVLCVVIRYFGGTKLGIRGLIDAYGDSAREVLNSTVFSFVEQYHMLRISMKYTNLSTVEYKIRDMGGLWVSVNYGNDGVDVTTGFPLDKFASIKKTLDEMKGVGQLDEMINQGVDWVEIS